MSVSYQAVAVIGSKISLSCLIVGTHKIRCFDHNFPESMNYDPATGLQLWETENYTHPSYNEAQGTFAGFDVVVNDEFAWVGIVLGSVSDSGPWSSCSPLSTDLDLGSIHRRLQQVLRPLGAGDHCDFGMHLIMLCG